MINNKEETFLTKPNFNLRKKESIDKIKIESS